MQISDRYMKESHIGNLFSLTENTACAMQSLSSACLAMTRLCSGHFLTFKIPFLSFMVRGEMKMGAQNWTSEVHCVYKWHQVVLLFSIFKKFLECNILTLTYNENSYHGSYKVYDQILTKFNLWIEY